MARTDLALDVQPDRPLILLSNDDGVDANGLAALAATLQGLGTIAVVAPVQEQSAVGHSITVRDPIRAHPCAFEGPEGPIWARAVTGAPSKSTVVRTIAATDVVYRIISVSCRPNEEAS